MKNDKEPAFIFITIFCFCAVLFTMMRCNTHAQDRRALTEVEQQLHLSLSKMCANEAFHSYGDCLLIFQATRRHGPTPEERLAWLTEHSNCVLVQIPPRSMRGNCRWTRTLNLSEERPSGWDSRRDGVWEGMNQRQWARIVALVGNLLRGARPRGGWPCPIDPDTWAGRQTDAQRIAGLPPTIVPLRCTDPLNRERLTRNEGFRAMTPEQRERFEQRFIDINPGEDVDRN